MSEQPGTGEETTIPISKEARTEAMAAILAAIQEHRSILNTFHGESDRGAILVAASFLESTLEKVLRAVFVQDRRSLDQMFAFEGAVGTFSARIDVAFAIGLIHTKTAEHLHRIRKIRNECAHSPESVDFDTAVVRDHTGAMWDVDHFVPKSVREGSRRDLTRARFLTNAVMLYSQLLLILRDAHASRREQLWLTHHIQKEAAVARAEAARAELEASQNRIAELERALQESLAEYATEQKITLEEARNRLDAAVADRSTAGDET